MLVLIEPKQILQLILLEVVILVIIKFVKILHVQGLLKTKITFLTLFLSLELMLILELLKFFSFSYVVVYHVHLG